MKKIYKTAMIRRFSELMKSKLEKFEPVPPLAKSHLHSHGQHYVEQVTPTHWLFVSVLPDSRGGHENFSVEVGWSRLGRIPEHTDSRAALNFKTEWLDKPEFSCYLVGDDQVGAWYFERICEPLPHQIINAPLKEDVVRAVVEPIVDKAMSILMRDGVSILDKLRSCL